VGERLSGRRCAACWWVVNMAVLFLLLRHAICPSVWDSLAPETTAERHASTSAPTWLTKQGFLCCYLSSSWWFCHMEVNPSSVGLFLASYQILI
jgi:hypothetical protein